MTKNEGFACSFSYKKRTSKSLEASQLEDYPRAVHVNTEGEIHLDLQVLMIEYAKVIALYSEKFGAKKDKI
jgi:hypothetical protein